jgi:hypothetical protein
VGWDGCADSNAERDYRDLEGHGSVRSWSVGILVKRKRCCERIPIHKALLTR